MPLDVATSPEALSPARGALAGNAAALDAARRDHAGTRPPVERARSLIEAEARAEAALKAAVDADEHALGEWLRHGRGRRPEPNLKRRGAAEAALQAARRDAEAARRALPGLEAVEGAARARVAACEARRAPLVRALQLEHAAALARRVTALMTEAAAARARFYALADVFAEAGRGGDHGAFRDAEALGRIAPPLQLDPGNVDVAAAGRAWRAFADALAGDPNAVLPE